jgi:hypothetical protein
MKVVVKVEPGVCNFDTVVTADSEDSQRVTFEFASECETIKAFGDLVREISPVDAIMTLGNEENPVLAKARELLQAKGCCEACVVPAAAVKAMQVAAGLALPRDVTLGITKE